MALKEDGARLDALDYGVFGLEVGGLGGSVGGRAGFVRDC